MPKPVTPMVGADVFITDDARRVLLIQRRDNGFWALPGGCQDLGETPAQCAVRECREETGLEVRLTRLLGVFSSERYAHVNYPWKNDGFTHLLFGAEIVGGTAGPTDEAADAAFFAADALPPLSDGHAPRVEFGFRALHDPAWMPYFE